MPEWYLSALLLYRSCGFYDTHDGNFDVKWTRTVFRLVAFGIFGKFTLEKGEKRSETIRVDFLCEKKE